MHQHVTTSIKIIRLDRFTRRFVEGGGRSIGVAGSAAHCLLSVICLATLSPFHHGRVIKNAVILPGEARVGTLEKKVGIPKRVNILRTGGNNDRRLLC